MSEAAPARAASRKGQPLPIVVRRARAEDRDAVLAFASRTWDGWDYIPEAWPAWLDAPDGVLLVATPAADGEPVDAAGEPLDPERPVAVARVALVAEREAWLEGIRVDPRVRGRSVATHLQVAELRWAAAQGARVVRYFTGRDNVGSHRLGEHHGFVRLAGRRSYGRRDEDEGPPLAPEVMPALRMRLAAAGLVLDPGADAGELAGWWARLESEATFQAADGLYEARAWALATLTPARFAGHVAAGDVLTVQSGSDWALAILRPIIDWPADDRPHLALVAGSLGPLIDLLQQVEHAAGRQPRVRLPEPDPPLLLGGGAERLRAAGYPPAGWALVVYARDIEPAALPQPEARGLLRLGEEPRPVTRPAIGW
ncbi:MAG TPA: GNAT family N-acetyltransferase [Candidatus Limnocylindrales bacterium]|nr:GNAT family N-acetyltransferase [Candidatus Limnocylindrales bacterium]